MSLCTIVIVNFYKIDEILFNIICQKISFLAIEERMKAAFLSILSSEYIVIVWWGFVSTVAVCYNAWNAVAPNQHMPHSDVQLSP